MATVPYTDFFPEVMPHVPGCPDVMVLNSIRNAAVVFCNKSLYWQETRAAVPLTAADMPYTLEAPTGALVATVLSASIEGQPLGKATMDELDNRVFNWRGKENQPQCFYQPNPEQLVLYPLPAGTDSYDVVLRVSYAPLRDSTDIIDFIYQNQLDVIAAGALANLLSMPTAAWANPPAAAAYKAVFDVGTGMATVDTNKSYTRAANQIQMRAF